MPEREREIERVRKGTKNAGRCSLFLFVFFCYLTAVCTSGHVPPISGRQSPKMDGVVRLLLVRTEKDREPYRLRTTLQRAANNLISRKDLRASLNKNSWKKNVARVRERECATTDRYVISLLDYNLDGWRPSL